MTPNRHQTAYGFTKHATSPTEQPASEPIGITKTPDTAMTGPSRDRFGPQGEAFDAFTEGDYPYPGVLHLPSSGPAVQPNGNNHSNTTQGSYDPYRPWYVPSQHRPSQNVGAHHPPGPSDRYNPLSRWYNEPEVEGPYHALSSSSPAQSTRTPHPYYVCPGSPHGSSQLPAMSENSAVRGEQTWIRKAYEPRQGSLCSSKRH